jgi:hypothetical protein
MSSLNGDIGHEKKIETAKEKKEQADKAFQASDLQNGTSIRPPLSLLFMAPWRCSTVVFVALRFYHEVNAFNEPTSRNRVFVVD